MIKLIAKRLGVEPEDITGSSRKADLVAGRAAICLMMRGYDISLPQIGHILGERDHSSILHLLRVYPVSCRRPALYKECVTLLRIAALEPMAKARPPLPVKPVPTAAPVIVFAPKRARNDFTADDEPDSSHAFHDGIAGGSSLLLQALRKAA